MVYAYCITSLLPKMDELRAVNEASKPDMVCIVETWLDGDITDGSSLVCNMFCDGSPDLEFLSVSILSGLYSEKLCLCLLYRPPLSPVSIFENLCRSLFLSNPNQFSNFLLIGDFSVNLLNKKHYLFSYINDILCSISLSQVVPSYTRE